MPLERTSPCPAADGDGLVCVQLDRELLHDALQALTDVADTTVVALRRELLSAFARSEPTAGDRAAAQLAGKRAAQLDLGHTVAVAAEVDVAEVDRAAVTAHVASAVAEFATVTWSAGDDAATLRARKGRTLDDSLPALRAAVGALAETYRATERP